MATKNPIASERPAKNATVTNPVQSPLTDETGTFGQWFGGQDEYGGNQEQLRETAQGFHGLSSSQWADLSPSDKAEAINSAIAGLDKSSPSMIDPNLLASTKQAAKKASSDTNAPPTTMSGFAQELAGQYAAQAEEAIGAEGATLADENKAVTNAIAPFLTGSTSYNAGGKASEPVQAAMDAYAKAYASGEGVQSAAYSNMGLANEKYLATAPEQAFLQLLSQPGTEYYKQIPQQLLTSLPESLQYALSVSGVPNVPVPKGGWPKSLTGSGGSVANALTTIGATPASSPGTIGSNPATPGA